MSHSTDTGTDTATRKRFRIKGIRKGTTKLESMKLLCISMEGKSEEDACRLLDMLSSIGFRWGSGHELREHEKCFKSITSLECWLVVRVLNWDVMMGSVAHCKKHYQREMVTIEHLEVLIEDFLYEHQS